MKVSIVGGSGYAGGELLRILLQHPEVEIVNVTSERFNGEPVTRIHPNLRSFTNLKFSSVSDLKDVDTLFLGLPHGDSMNNIKEFNASKIIDLSADFRLKSKEDYLKWYNVEHVNEELLSEFVYGLPEIHREEIKKARFVAAPGCNATCTILGLYPLRKLLKDVFTEAKCGSSEGGNKSNDGSHHPERSRVVRSYKPSSHRHQAEMLQELGVNVHFSATSIEMVRGILTTSHVMLDEDISEKDIWKMYREAYANEPFMRIVKERKGIYRYPEPKLLQGTNFCDVGFERDKHSNRLIVVSAIDNLMKGAAGQAVQCMNLMEDFKEDLGLEFPGLHPV